jgi:hypothetical protein
MAEPLKVNEDGTPREQVTLFDIPPPGPDCGDETPTGRLSPRFDYVVKTINNGGRFYGECEPWLYGNMQVDNLQINGTATGTFQGAINVQSWKGFDISHPNKSNFRLRHICLEGPEAGVYIRGRVKNENIIKIPSYWIGLIDFDSITISLTQIGCSQDLIVDKICSNENVIYIRSGNKVNIDCYYTLCASRIDGEKLIVEYPGETPADYPGDSTQYSISGYDYGRKGG